MVSVYCRVSLMCDHQRAGERCPERVEFAAEPINPITLEAFRVNATAYATDVLGWYVSGTGMYCYCPKHAGAPAPQKSESQS